MANSPDFNSHSIRILDSDDGVEQIDSSFLTSPLDVSPDKTEVFRRRLSPVAFLEEIDTII